MNQRRIKRLLIVGWDSADPALVESLIRSGRLPNLASLIQRGLYTRLASTEPPSSLPAWTSAFSGVGPGRHGLVDFVRKDPGRYRLRLVSAVERIGPTLFSMVARQGRRVACLGVPGTFPPDPEAGICISGFDSPTATRASRRAHSPPELKDLLDSEGIFWPYGEMDELAVGEGWHDRASQVLLATIGQKLRVAETLLQEKSFDLFTIVFSEADTASHHFWAWHDRDSPRRSRGPEKEHLAGTVEKVYEELDRALGRLLQFVDEQTAIIVMSDHGAAGSSDHVVCFNRWLATRGWLRFHGIRGAFSRIARLLRDRAARLLPDGVKQALLRGRMARWVMAADGIGRFGEIDFAHTQAFSDELPQFPGIWLNLSGRERKGVVEPGAEETRLVEEISRELLAWTDPSTGRKVVSRVLPRTETLDGPCAHRAPDIRVELACWDGYRLLAAPSSSTDERTIRRLGEHERIGSKGVGTSGVHLPDGVLVAMGPGIESGGIPEGARIVDICPTALSLLELPVPKDLDGRCLFRGKRNLSGGAPVASEQPEQPAEKVYSPEEERIVRERLEKLGYL